jgi:hypothetical protein
MHVVMQQLPLFSTAVASPEMELMLKHLPPSAGCLRALRRLRLGLSHLG